MAAAYFYGLPEQKIEEVILDYVTVTYEIQPEPDVPAMTCGIKPRIKQGIFAANIKKLFLRDVSIRGQIGEALILQQIDQVDRAGFCHKRETKL